MIGHQNIAAAEKVVELTSKTPQGLDMVILSTVKEEIFVGEKFCTFPSTTFRMEFNFVLSNWPKKGKN